MGFSGIGIWEILLILIVALLALGPRRLPEIARTLGKAVRAIRKASADLTTSISRELEETKDKPPPSSKEEAKSKETPSSVNDSGKAGQDDHSPKREGHQQRNE
jgi:sec-independent protein translocase protein TatA